ncbi:mechanosensitive ion channel family protein [Rubritalea sp.]|uniref:mechanosensitive ion channel family protein n=1 Tax=Rubritalea sp. TaxID=2109375 RepID=UPI003EF556A7
MESVNSIAADVIAHLPNIFAGIIVLIITWIVALVFKKVIPKVISRFHWRTSLEELFLTLGKVAIYILGFLVAAMVLFPGLTPAKLLGAAGLASVAVGLAFKDIFQNFFAGILLLWKFPFEPGDFIVCGDVRGRVVETELRLTTLRASSGELIIVPNAHLVGNPIDVLTDKDIRRVELMTGVAYSEDVAAAVKLIKETVSQCNTVDQAQPLDVLASNFGDSSIDISVLYWTGSSPMDFRKSKNEVITAIKEALDNAGIEIPFPYRTMTFSEPLKIENISSKNPDS